MNVLSRLWSALGRLADAVNALADVAERANTCLRGQLDLGGHEPPPAEAIDQPPAALPDARNGRRSRVRA